MIGNGMLLAINDPPVIFIPTFTDAPLGWVIALLVLVGPIAFSITTWQRRRGHWRYFFAQWQTPGFWMLWLGAIVAAGGIFGLVGLAPAWQAQWDDWYLAANINGDAAGIDAVGLAWLHDQHGQYAFALQIAAGSLFLLGAAAVVVGVTQLSRRMAAFRADPDAWLVTSPESQKVPVVRRGRRG